LLESAGYQVDWHSYPMQHAVCQEEIQAIRTWLLARLDGWAPAASLPDCAAVVPASGQWSQRAV